MEKQDLTEKLTQIQGTEEPIQPSRVLLLIFDALENFEYKYYKIAGCLYTILVSLVMTFLLTMRDKHFSQLPYLELIFVPILIMFCANFRMLSNSNILPYITEQALNWKVKHAGMMFLQLALSLILSIVFLICSFQEMDKYASVFFFISVWPFNYLYEKLILKQEHSKQYLLPLGCLFIGTAFSTGTIQQLALNPEQLSLNGVAYAIVGGLLLCYSADCFKKLDTENLFTITHVIGLMTIIFLPLFFPIEGLCQPGFKEWVFFTIISGVFLVGFPVIIRSFAIENSTFVLSQLGWCLPFYIFFKFLFGLQIPSFGQLVGVGIFIASSLVILKLQNGQENKVRVALQKKTEQNKIVELQTLVQHT